ncbi:RHS repeat-associated core domain-containing protein, partial [Streptomyces boncukensis]
SCATPPDKHNIGGSDPYWLSFDYDKAGNRTREVRHGLGAGGNGTDQEADADTVRTYTYGTPGESSPNTLRSVTTTGSTTNTADAEGTETFAHDAAGNTTSRAGGTRDQKLTWDAEGHLETVKEGATTADYLYTPDGDRLLAHNPDGSSTLYLPEGNELTSSGGKVTGTRYYTYNDRTVATRTTGEGIHYLFSDQQGTALIAVAFGSSQLVTRRKQLPFGGPRNGAASGGTAWPGTRGFVDGTQDPTGTTHLGAREYDPELGRFLSVDPLLATDDQRQHNSYQYGGNNPATFSDPSGEALWDDVTKKGYGNAKVMKRHLKHLGYLNRKGRATRKYRALEARNWRTYRRYLRTSYPKVVARQHAVARQNAAARRAAAARAAAARKAAKLAADRKAAEQRQKSQSIKGKILGGIKAGWNKTGGKAVTGVKDFGKWTWRNRSNIAKGAAVGAFVTCTFATEGACAVVGGAAFGISVTNRTIDFRRTRGWRSKNGSARYFSGIALDTVGWRIQTVRNLHMFGSGHTNFLHAMTTRSGQQRLYQQGTAVTWGTLGW